MPKVDPRTHEPVSDAPFQSDPDLAGGKREGDPGMEHATPWGGPGNPFHRYHPTEYSVAVGEKPSR